MNTLRIVIPALVLCFSASTPAQAQQLNASDFSAFDRRLTDLEKRVAALEAKQFTPMGTPKPPTTSFRAPSGHTHTCANGHTWDHTMDGGSHFCPFCGLEQRVVDTRRPASIAVPNSQPYTPQYTITQAGGCADGSCSSGYTGRTGIFNREDKGGLLGLGILGGRRNR